MTTGELRGQIEDRIITDLIDIGIIRRTEAGRYRKVVETYDSVTLVKVLLRVHALREATPPILRETEP